MTAIQQWGRKESLIWPPRGFYFTYGAIFLALLATGFLIYVRYSWALSPLEQYYLPYYFRTATAGYAHPTSTYQLVYISDGKSRARIALDADVQPGEHFLHRDCLARHEQRAPDRSVADLVADETGHLLTSRIDPNTARCDD